ncbi:MAG: TonB-dependent receptor plug domain-containing protein, partial [Solimonas sp.]
MRKQKRGSRVVLTVGVSALTLCPALARAQDAAPPAPAADNAAVEEIVVTGIRASLAKSLDTKRNSEAVVEALTAEDIGQFPNTNIAEAMALVPGVTIDRRFGQGERVSIDGTDPSLNLTFLDGHPVAQSTWLYGEQPNRGFDQTQIASEIIGRLEIYKSPEARLTEGSLGGTVLMHTRKPLDMDANSFSGSAGYNYSDQASEGKPSISALYSWKDHSQTFGFNIAAQHYEEQVDRQGIEIFGYVPASSFANVTGIDPNAQVPNFINAAWFQQERKRDSVTANLQFKPTDALEFNLNGLYVKEDFANYNQSVYNWLTLSPNSVDQLNVGSNGVVTSGHSSGNAPVVYDSAARVSEPTTKGVDLQTAYKGEGWGLSGQIGYSKADNEMQQYLVEPIYRGGYSWDINKGITFDDPASAREPGRWGEVFSNNGNFFTESKDTYGQLDFSKKFDGFFKELLVGARSAKHEEEFSLLVYGPGRGGSLADVGTSGFADSMGGFSGFSNGHGHHIQIGRGNTIGWVKGSPIDYSKPDPGSFINNSYSMEQTNT